MDRCPTEERLAVYAAGACGEQDAHDIATHLEVCDRCRELVERDRANNDWLVGIRSPAEVETVAVGREAIPTKVEPAQPLDAQATPLRPVEIKRYRILRELDMGGQSVIYQAIQEATGQKVAIKVPREGRYITKAERRRFEREIELVAQLKHPNIISIFDSGFTEDGRKYYAMDYVRGQRLHQYVRDKKLSLEQTLRLFATVCDAVQFAHQRGVIHRDLKPSNILVDADGNPKILDFGLARSMSASAHTAVSMTQELLGTLPYMSPEQTRGDPDEIDTRTDVYALGVILYELLTGKYPYPVTGNVMDVLRTITEAEPSPPSRQWTPDEGIRGRSHRRLRRGECPIDNEVHTIVLKALSKERERRYQSARELADDVRRYLANEPIEAKRDSGWYVLKKTLRRYRIPVGFVCAFFIVTAFSLVVVFEFWRQSEAEALEKKRALDATDALMTDGLDKLRGAHVDEAFRWLHTYQQIAAEDRAGVAFSELRARLDEFKQEVLSKLDDTLATNRIGALVRTLNSDADLLTTLDTLNRHRAANDIKERIISRLKQLLAVPMPAGRGQSILDCRALLGKLSDQDNATGAAFSNALRQQPLALHDAMLAESFDNDTVGECPPKWSDKDGFVSVVSVPQHTLRVESIPKYGPGTCRQLEEPIEAPVVSLCLSVRFGDSDPPATAIPHGSFHLVFTDGEGCQWPGCHARRTVVQATSLAAGHSFRAKASEYSRFISQQALHQTTQPLCQSRLHRINVLRSQVVALTNPFDRPLIECQTAKGLEGLELNFDAKLPEAMSQVLIAPDPLELFVWFLGCWRLQFGPLWCV